MNYKQFFEMLLESVSKSYGIPKDLLRPIKNKERKNEGN